jgi:GNAT superfamily N-acetyltransferase
MVEIRPMGEDCILPRCLHAGPIGATVIRVSEPADVALAPHPWSDETIRDLVAERPDFGLCDAGEGFPAEFMREMIQRYGTCALLAWEGGKVVGFVRFYPMEIARMVDERRAGRAEPILDPTLACDPEHDHATLWVHCVMTSRPYTGGTTEVGSTSGGDRIFRAAEEAGARKGVGLRLAKALVPWAREHGWKRIIKIAPCDLDFFYGIWGGGGKTFWEKAGFRAVGTIYRPQEWSEEDMATLRAQTADKGMTEEDAWTFHRMAYEL